MENVAPATNQRLRVLLVGIGGVNQAFKNSTESSLGRALAARGHEVYSYSYLDPKWPVHEMRDEDVDGVHVHRVGVGPVGFSWDLWQAMRTDPLPDIVNVHHLRNDLLWQALLFFQRRRIPVVLTPIGVLHDRFLTNNRDDPLSYPIKYDNLIFDAGGFVRQMARELSPRKHLHNWLTHFPLKRPDHFIALTQFEKDLLIRLGIPENKISIITHAIDLPLIDATLAQNRPAQDFDFPRPRILFIGQLKFRKGFDLLIRAAPKVRAAFPTASFLFVSYNLSQREAFMRAVDDVGAREYIHLIEQRGGSDTEEEKIRQYVASDVYVLPTRYEGFSIPIMEAMACRVPIVSTQIPPVQEALTDGEEGLLARMNDPEDLADKIITVLKDPDLRRRLVENGRRRAEACYTEPVLAERTVAVYRKALAEVGRRRE